MRLGNLRAIPVIMGVTLKQNFTDGFVIFTIFIQPLLIAILGLWMLQGRGGDYGIYVVVGSGMAGLWSSLLFMGGNSINWERWFGTLQTIVGVPTPMSVVVFGKNLSHVFQSLLSMIVTYLLASAILGYPLSVAMPGAFVISLFAAVIAFIAFGLIIAPLFVLNPAVQQWQNGFEFPVYLLSGFLFPVLLLPDWTTPISYILPTYWAARALHMAARATGTVGEIALSWLVLAGSSLVFLGLSSILFRTMIKRAKKQATLDLV